jgi:N-acetylglucosaminyldiphosphoundecaprenol N-acetyl-beta-D-mannosaminyltransferase
VLNVNAHCLNLCYEDPELRGFMNGAEVVFCDGAGVMLAARIQGRLIPQRITYADWIWQLADFAAAQGFSLYLLGARHGYFDRGAGSAAVVREINAATPDILLVGLGMPLQERWLMENWQRLDVRVALTGGAVFDYASGRSRRGPRLLRDNGFEWLARLLAEPRRLWRRYLLGNPLFLLRVLRQRLGSHTPPDGGSCSSDAG